MIRAPRHPKPLQAHTLSGVGCARHETGVGCVDLTVEWRHGRVQMSQSAASHIAPIQRATSTRSRLPIPWHAWWIEALAYVAVTLSLWGLLGGWETFTAHASQQQAGRAWLSFPVCLAYLAPLLIPFTTYVVIARWTGEKLFRHA